MKLLLKILLPLVVLGSAGGISWQLIRNREELKPQPRVEELPLVEVRTIKPGAHRLKVRAQGEVTARTEINLVGEVPGKVVFVSTNFSAGAFFAPDELLLRLDQRDYEVAVAQAEAAVAQAQVRLEREEAEAKVALQEWEALGKGAANPLLLRKPQLAEAKAGLAAATANLRKSRLDLSRCEVRAPFAGRVRDKLVDVGQFVGVGSPLARIYSVDHAEVRLPIPLEEFAFVDLPLNTTRDVSLPVVLRAKVGGELQSWSGRLIRTEGAVDRRTRMLTAVVRVEDPYGLRERAGQAPLPVGLFVEAEIEGSELADIHRVPRSAIRGHDTLLAVDGEEKLRFRQVEIVRRLPESVLVKRGLNPGDRVCVSVLEAPVDGMSVRVREVVEAE